MVSPALTHSRRWSPATSLKAVLAVALTIWAIFPVLTEPAKPLRAQPLPDSAEYADGAWQLGHGHGYVTFVNDREATFGSTPHPPRYPFGTSAALAPFAFVINRFPQSVQIGTRTISVLYVLAVVVAAWLLGGPLAAGIAAVLVGSSPFAHVSAGLIMSDALASLITVGILVALSFSSRRSAGVAGALAGALVCVRLLGVVSIPAVLLAVSGRRRFIVAACATPFLAVLALYQWKTFGSPLRTGYDYWLPGLQTFSTSFPFGQTTLIEGPFIFPDRLNGAIFQSVCPCGIGGSMTALSNVAFYPSVAAGLFWVFTPPLTGLIGLGEMIVDRTTPAARFALVTVALNLGLVLFYFDSAARFIAPAASLLLVYSAHGISRLLTLLWRATPSVTPRALDRRAATQRSKDQDRAT